MREFIKQLRESKAVILDTETTGLDRNAEILQIGVCSLDGDAMFNSLVKPARARRWNEAMRVHGISQTDVEDAPTLEQLSGELKQVLSGRSVAIYNADFDTRMLRQSIKAGGSSSAYEWTHGQQWECVMKAYAEYWGQWNSRYGNYRWQSLSAACRQQGVKVVNAHDALTDAKLTAALIRSIENKYERS